MTDAASPNTPRNLGAYDAPHVSPVAPVDDARTIMINQLSWGAVFAGAILALVTQLILNIIGVGIGAATLDPGTADNPTVRTFSIFAGVWWLLSGIIAALAGGYAAGRLGGKAKESTASWHGLVSWAVATLIVFYLLSSAVGGVLGGGYRTMLAALGAPSGVAAPTVSSVVGPNLSRLIDPVTTVERSLRDAVGDVQGSALRDSAAGIVRAATVNDRAEARASRDRAAELLARSANIPISQARVIVERQETQYRDTLNVTRAEVAGVADTTATAVSTTALLGALGLILGAVAGWFGGSLGTVEPTISGRLTSAFRADPSSTGRTTKVVRAGATDSVNTRT